MARWRLLLTCLACGTSLLAASAFATPGDENWDDAFGVPGAQQLVQDAVTLAGDLIIAGDFQAVGGVAARGVARWDGTQWSPLGDGLDDGVYALVVWNGDLYAGGGFSGGLARWDGASWAVVDGGVDGYVESLAVWNDDLVVAGSFSAVGGGDVVANNVAVYDGAGWNDLAAGTNGPVNDAAVFGGSLHVCGQFDFAGSTFAANVARWNGASWAALSGGLRDAANDPFEAYGSALAVHGGQLVVAGQFARAGGVTVDGVARWNGTTFSAMGSPFASGEMTALGAFGADLVGSTASGSILRWNGAVWLTLGSADGPAAAIVEHGGGLVVGGAFTVVNGTWMPNLARYAGSWAPLAGGQGASGPVECFGTWNGMTIMGGRFGRAGAVAGVIAAWDGDAWTPLGSGIPATFGQSVESVVAFGDDLVVGGAFSTAGGVAANKIARYDGAQWHAMGPGSLATVSGLLVLDDVLYANGYWSGQQTLGRWNGADFTPLGTGVAGGTQILYGLGSFQDDPVMGGGFTSVDGVSANNIARWDGNAWQPLGAGTSGAVFAIQQVGNLLYVGGVFQQAGGAPASNVAAWDGANWHALGSGVNGRVFDLTSHGNDVYVTGEFTQAGGQPARYVARWDGAAWHPLGSGLDAEGHAVASLDGGVWVGGEFVTAGTAGSSRVARWQPGGATATPLPTSQTRIAMSPARPNPFAGGTVLSLTLAASADVVVDVFDVRGAHVRSLSLPGLAAGRHSVQWDGRDAAGLPAPAGVYFLAVRDGAHAARQRVVLVR